MLRKGYREVISRGEQGGKDVQGFTPKGGPTIKKSAERWKVKTSRIDKHRSRRGIKTLQTEDVEGGTKEASTRNGLSAL